MKAVILQSCALIEQAPLKLTSLPTPQPKDNEILIRISVCGLCHTDLDEIEGRLRPPHFPIVLGHQVVGAVEANGPGATRFQRGDRVGVTWLHSCCRECDYCRSGRENLCTKARWTGKDVNGGYAEYMTIGQDFAQRLPNTFTDTQAAPLLCAGVIGYRTFRLAEVTDTDTIAIFGFGASAHIVIQILKHKFPNLPVYVFTRSEHHQQLAHELGADWTGQPTDTPPQEVTKAFDFTPAGEIVKTALTHLAPGGRLVINAIRKSTTVPELCYAEHLWHEKQIQSIANVTRADAEEFLPLAAQIPIQPIVEEFALEDANKALLALKDSRLHAAAVLRIT